MKALDPLAAVDCESTVWPYDGQGRERKVSSAASEEAALIALSRARGRAAKILLLDARDPARAEERQGPGTWSRLVRY